MSPGEIIGSAANQAKESTLDEIDRTKRKVRENS
jgi:hypothetical protein